MSFLDRMDRKFGRYAIPNLSAIIVIGQILTYALFCTKPQDLQFLVFDPQKVLTGQIWRVITFVILPPSLNPIWLLLSVFCFHFMGKALESHWGSLRYNLYLFISIVATVIVGFIFPQQAVGVSQISLSVFLAFAYVYPDFKVYIYFIIPVKAKYIALLTWIIIVFQLVTEDWIGRCHIVASIANFLIFFGAHIARRVRHGQQSMSRTIEKMRRTFHKCKVCGKTEKDDVMMEFRCCSKCAGSIEYCMDHIKDHEHVIAESKI